MAKELHAKANGKPPITRHPLFPATVALWFGTLFGLGSLAIRASLLEAVISTLKIDAIFASAAPPIGATPRILLALAMAGVGGLLGSRLARRIGRPRTIVQPRKRGAGLPGKGFAGRTTLSSPPASAPAPEASPPVEGRRSRLALTDEGTHRHDYHEHAPLPGAAPHILDVGEFALEGFEEAPAHRYGKEAPAAAQPSMYPGAQVFIPASGEPEPMAAMPPRPKGEAPSIPFPFDEDGATHAPFAAPADAGSSPPFQPAAQTAPENSTFPVKVEAPAPFAAPPAPHCEPAAALPTSDAANMAPAPLPALAPISVFNQEPTPGLFTQPLSASVSRINWLDAPVAPVEAARPATPATPVETASAAIEPPPSQRIAKGVLDDLSHLELVERLAIAMRRKHGAKAPADAMEAEAADIPVPDTAPAADVAPAQAEAGETAPFAMPAQLPEPEAAATAVPPFDAPRAGPAMPPVPVIPAALRPIGLHLEHDDEETMPAHVPPRHIGPDVLASQPPAARDPAPFAPPAPTAAPAAPVEPIDGAGPASAEDAMLADGYSSLLALSRPTEAASRFVRIEEPEPLAGEIEPVVVFPGQEARSAAAAMPGSPPFGPPDANAPAGPSPSFDRRPPSGEIENSLRSALATLQRMSGAA